MKFINLQTIHRAPFVLDNSSYSSYIYLNTIFGGIKMYIKNLFSKFRTRLEYWFSAISLMNKGRLISFLLLAWVSLNLSFDMFKDFGGTHKDSSLFVLMIVGLELSKIISLILSKTNFTFVKAISTQYLSSLLRGVGYLLLYVVLASVSIFAAYGFVRTAIEYTTQKTIVSSKAEDIQYYKDLIEESNNKIKGYAPFLASEKLSIASKEKYEKLIKDEETKREENRLMLNSLNEVKLDSGKNAGSMYGLIAEDMGIDEKTIRFRIQFSIVVIIEVCLAVMAPGLHEVPKPTNSIPEEKKEGTPNPPVPEPEPKKKRKYERKKPYSKRANKVKKTETVTEPTPLHIEEEKEVATITSNGVEEETTTPIVEIPKRETAFEKFVHALFDNGMNTSLRNKLEASEASKVPLYKANEFFTALSSVKVDNIPLIEFRKDKKWYPNFTEQYILALYHNGGVIKEEGIASETK